MHLLQYLQCSERIFDHWRLHSRLSRWVSLPFVLISLAHDLRLCPVKLPTVEEDVSVTILNASS